MKLRISLLIPLVLLLSTLGSSFLVYQDAKRSAVSAIREDAIKSLNLDISRLQNVLYNLLTESADNLEEARLNLSVTAMDPTIRTLLLTDDIDTVVMANRYLWEGSKAQKVTSYNTGFVSKVKQSNSPLVFFDENDQTWLTGYYPVVLQLESQQGLPVNRLGVLFVEVSIATKLAHTQRNALNQSLGFSALMSIVSIFVAILLHIIVSRRLGRLTHAADQLSTGKLETKLALGGTDEISQLGRSFDEMAARITHEFERREEAEHELRKLNETLEQRITNRTDELEKKKKELIDSQARAHQANKMAALGEMASGIAHEINSPLQAISLLTYMLKHNTKTNLVENNLDAEEKIERAVEKITNIVESLRKMSRDSSGDPSENVKISEILNDALGISEERYKLRGIKIDCNYLNISEDIVIRCQRLQIGQIIINLLNNAYDAVLESHEKLIQITVSETNTSIKITICDSGGGIPKEQRNKIFEPMFTSKEIGKGTGLGLSISAEIAMQHNGSLTLDAESEYTCFSLTLPKRK